LLFPGSTGASPHIHRQCQLPAYIFFSRTLKNPPRDFSLPQSTSFLCMNYLTPMAYRSRR